MRPRKPLASQMPLASRCAAWCWVALALMFAAACVPSVDDGDDASDGDDQVAVDDGSSSTSSDLTTRTTGVPTMQPTSAEELGIPLDSAGRPYDNDWGPLGDGAETRTVATFEIPDGVVEVIDADTLYLPGPIDIRDTETVRFRTTTELELSVVWQRRGLAEDESPTTDDRTDPVRWYELSATGGEVPEGADDGAEAVLGVLLADPEATIARWGPFEAAYDSRGGVGAFTSRSVINWAGRNLTADQAMVETPLTAGLPLRLVEVDDVEGPDVFVFDNGAGGGPAVLSEGFDENDQLVAMMLWDPRYPWRLAVADGEPPADVTEREDELIDCIEGRRLVDRWGRCT